MPNLYAEENDQIINTNESQQGYTDIHFRIFISQVALNPLSQQ
ncbi:hypothetical protein [Helicobacter trogontum]|nr:hypothetical protein [Helicobacter trogontum]